MIKQFISAGMLIFTLFTLSLHTSCTQADLSEDDFISPSSQITKGYVYTVSDVTSFTWRGKNPAWKQPSYNRLWTSRFVFKNNGEFVYQFDYDATYYYTLTGKYFEDGNDYHFIAEYSVYNGGGSQQILVSGTVKPSANRQFKVNMEYGSSAYYGAIINEQEFLNQADKRFQTTLLIE